MLSVADQKSSNDSYNCTGQAGLYQLAVKMVTNICSMQIPYSRVVFCVDTLHSISIFLEILSIHPADFFPHIDSKKVCTLIKHSVTKWSGKCMVHGLMDRIPRKKTKTLPLRKIRVFYFSVQFIIAKSCDSPPCYCCHLECHLKYFTMLKNNNNMPANFSKYNQKLSEIRILTVN